MSIVPQAYQFQLLPELAQTEYEALKADIAQNGVLVPVELDEHGEILDGHHRIRAWTELKSQGVRLADYASIVRLFHNDDQKIEHALKLNLTRRHLDREQLKAIAIDLRGRGEYWTLEKVGETLGVSYETVRRWVPLPHFTDVNSETTPVVVNTRGQKRPPTYKPRAAKSTVATNAKQQKKTVSAMEMFAAEQEQSPDEDAQEELSTASDVQRSVHVSNNSGENEWYTPAQYIAAAREVMGDIDLDPASSNKANETVNATTYYTKEHNGLAKPWYGRVWMNPPYAQPLISHFSEKVVQEFTEGNISQAIVLVNNATDTRWFQGLAAQASSVCFPAGRVRFLDPEGRPGAPLQGQAILYLGTNTANFRSAFGGFGVVL